MVQPFTLVSLTNTISCGPEFYTCVFQGQYDLFSEVYTPFQVVQTFTLVSQTNTISCGPEFYNCVFQGQCDLFSEVYTPFQMA